MVERPAMHAAPREVLHVAVSQCRPGHLQVEVRHRWESLAVHEDDARPAGMIRGSDRPREQLAACDGDLEGLAFDVHAGDAAIGHHARGPVRRSMTCTGALRMCPVTMATTTSPGPMSASVPQGAMTRSMPAPCCSKSS